MEEFKELLASNLPMIPKELIPAVSLGLIFISVILIFLFFVVCVIYINSQPKPGESSSGDSSTITPLTRDDVLKQREGKGNESDEEKEEAAEEAEAARDAKTEELPPIAGRLGEILGILGILKIGPLTKAFLKALHIMRNSTYDLRWRYKLPCFMILGPQGSGKTTLLNNLTFEHLCGSKESDETLWKLFKEGAVFEFPNIDKKEDKSKFWSFISELFIFIRPRRPLDGLIITLPADYLLSDIVNLEAYAREMFDRIFKFQHDINFKLPIYLIITKTDKIYGFQEFVHLLKENTKQQIFGWSCPYSLDIAFSPNWISEIFNTIDDGIRKALSYFSTKRNIDDDLERAILFEPYFERVKSRLSEYLLTMFKTHNPMDGMILRGVYFVGRQKEVALSPSGFVQVSALTPGVNIDASLNHLHNDDLFFVQDLFKDKIFKEFNIAHPIIKNAGGMTKKEFRNKAIFAGSILALSIGWVWGNANIRNTILRYEDSMLMVKKNLLRIKYLEDTIKTDEDQVLINNQASNLLQNMPAVKKWEFFSIFVPQSWFFSLENAVRSTIELVFDSVVVKAMYIDLNYNTKNILLSSSTSSKKTLNSKQDIFDVVNFESFKKLSEFTSQIKEIQRVSTDYNSMRTLEDSDNVASITEAIFKDKFEIISEMRRHVPNKKIMPPKFNLKDFQTNIEHSLRGVFTNFVNDALDVTVEKVLVNVAHDLDRIYEAGHKAREGYNVQSLAKLYTKLELVEDIFNNKNFAWIKKSKFAPAPEYVNLVKDLQRIEVISRECLKELLTFTELSFNQYKASLEKYKSKLSGRIIVDLNPSPELLLVKTELKSLLDLPFICVIPFGNFLKDLPDDKMLIWDVKRLKELCVLIDKYNEFAETVPEGMRAEYFDSYKSVAKKCFYPTIKAMLGNSQILEDTPLGKSKTLLENSYRKQAINVRNSSICLPKIIKIIDEFMSEENLEDFGFQDLIINQYVGLLSKIDAMFNEEKPYSTNAALFDDWSGEGNPSFMKMNSQANIRQYLNAQFERIRFLAKDLANPIIDLLTIPVIYDKIRDKKLINKWREIITNIDDYEANKPGNSIAALETFITENLNKVSLENFDSEGEIKNFSKNDSDYFLSKRSIVAQSLIDRADVVQYDRSAEIYLRACKIFNEKLSNKFPFSNNDSGEEASIKDLEDFVNAYQQLSAFDISILRKNKNVKRINSEVFNFIEETNKILPFLKAWVEQSKNTDPNTCPIYFNVLLRPFPNMEVKTSAVIDRMFSIDNTPATDNGNIAYFFGNQVVAIFGWVASSKEKPNIDKSEGNLRIEGDLAAFAYTGPWALFHIIEEHRITKGTELPNGIPLQFEVPVASIEDGSDMNFSKMVYKITPMLRKDDKATVLSWPVLPTVCPDLYKPAPATSKASFKPKSKQREIYDKMPNLKALVNRKEDKKEEKIKAPAPAMDVDVSFDEDNGED